MTFCSSPTPVSCQASGWEERHSEKWKNVVRCYLYKVLESVTVQAVVSNCFESYLKWNERHLNILRFCCGVCISWRLFGLISSLFSWQNRHCVYVWDNEDYGDSDLKSVAVDGCVVPNVPNDRIAYFTNQNLPTEYLYFFGNHSPSDTVSHPRTLES
jgi:hypothetical protein